MTTPQAMADWLADFTTRHDLDVVLGDDDYLIEQRAEMAAAYVADNVPARFADALPSIGDVQTWVADVVRSAMGESIRRGQRIVSIHSGPSLLLLGLTGRGKTHESYGAMRVISGLGLHSKWVVVSAADLYAQLRPRHGVDSEAEFDRIANAPVLAVDDMGAAKNSEWVEEINFRLVNRRYETMRPTLFTSNVRPKELAEKVGERVASRLTEMTKRVVVGGADRRRAA